GRRGEGGAVEGGGGAGRGRGRGKCKRLERQSKTNRRRLADTARRRRSLPHMNEAPQKGPGCQYDGRCPELAPIRELDASALVVPANEVVRLGFDDGEIGDRRDRALHQSGI